MAPANGHHESELDHFSPYRSDGKLYGFVCIVTGATHAVGRAIITELAAHGAAAVYACSAAATDDYAGLAEEVNKQHPSTKVIGYPFRLANEEDTLTLIDDVLNQWGRLDVFVNSSGLLGSSSVPSTTTDDLYKLFEANSMAPFFALKHAPPAMAKTTSRRNYANAAPKEHAYGSIIVVSSVASSYGGCGGPAFTMSSHAALGVVRAGVAALKGTGIRINCISAGQIDDGAQVPSPSLQNGKTQQNVNGVERAALPVEVARVAGFLASGFSSYTTGANIVVDGGASVMNPVTAPI